MLAGSIYGILSLAMIAAVVLAAGFSSRMGRPKALLPAGAGGPTFLERVVETLSEAGIGPVVVVVGADAPRIRAAVAASRFTLKVVENPDPSQGQLSSLHVALAALEAAEVEAVLVMPVDQPLVTAETVRRVVAAYRETHAPIVRPSRGALHGHPVIFDRTVFEDLRRADPSRGARDVIAARRDAAVDVPVDDEGAFVDIDTPDEYERAFGKPPAGE